MEKQTIEKSQRIESNRKPIDNTWRLVKEEESHKDNDQIFIANEIKNETDGNLTRKETKKRETYLREFMKHC